MYIRASHILVHDIHRTDFFLNGFLDRFSSSAYSQSGEGFSWEPKNGTLIRDSEDMIMQKIESIDNCCSDDEIYSGSRFLLHPIFRDVGNQNYPNSESTTIKQQWSL